MTSRAGAGTLKRFSPICLRGGYTSCSRPLVSNRSSDLSLPNEAAFCGLRELAQQMILSFWHSCDSAAQSGHPSHFPVRTNVPCTSPA